MDALAGLYQQMILDASRERYGQGILSAPQGQSFQINPTCGDQVTMQVELDSTGKRLEKIAWDGEGCTISQASISIMLQLVEGKTITEFTEILDAFRAMMDKRGQELSEAEADLLEDAAAFTGVSQFPARVKCALLGWMALHEAIEQALADRNTNE